MGRATLTLIGMYEFDGNIFDDMQIPAALDKEILINNLLLDCGMYETLYPNPAFFKIAVRAWSLKMLGPWEKLESTLHYEYNPINNYDRTENVTDTHAAINSESGTYTHDVTAGQTDTIQDVVTEAKGTTETTTPNKTTKQQISAYNQTGSMTDKEQTLETGTVTVAGSGSDTTSRAANNGSTATNDTDDTSNVSTNINETNTHTARIAGNIGVTTTQQMIQAEREIDTFNMYDVIIMDFKHRFCLLVE